MTEYPIFVPYGEEAIAAVLAVPDGRPRGLVLLLHGLGPTSRSHKYRLWSRLAQRLAARGIASIRLDYLGLGGSTGSPPASVGDLPTGQALAAAEVGLRALDVHSFAIVGHCYGAQAIFPLAEDPRCDGAAFVLFDDPRHLVVRERPEATAPRERAGGLRDPSQPTWKRLARSFPGLRAFVRWTRDRRLAWPQEFLATARATSVLFLLLRPEARSKTIRNAVSRLSRQVGRISGRSIEVRSIPHRAGLQRMPVVIQERVLAELGDWLDLTLPAAAPEPVTARVPASSLLVD